MSQFVDLTVDQFERAYERHRMRIVENAKQIRLFDHRIVELVCMDGRVPPIVPYGLAPIIPIAGGVPREGNRLYEAWLDHVIVSEQKRKHGTIQLIQLHTECAAFERNTETALNAALGFTGNLQEQYEKNVHGMILLYNVVHGGVRIFEPVQKKWYDLASLERDGEPNQDCGFYKSGSYVHGNASLVSDVAHIAALARRAKQMPGNIVQQHSELAIVAGNVTSPWLGEGKFLSYRADLVSEEHHAPQLKRAAEVVRTSLKR